LYKILYVLRFILVSIQNFFEMKIVKNRFEQLIREKGIETITRRQISVTLEAFDKLAEWAIELGINDKQMFYNKVSAWAKTCRLPKVQSLRLEASDAKQYKNIEDMLKDVKQQTLKGTTGATLRLNEDAYQNVMRWAVQQGASDKDDMTYLFSNAILKVTLPRPRKSQDEDDNEHEDNDD